MNSKLEDSRDGSPRISVVIPCKDRQPELDRAITSVLDQTLLPHEIIVIDDGSTTPLQVSQLPVIKLVRQANAGPAAARNKGAAIATGDWIALLDSDDLWYPSKLQEQWALIQMYSADFCFGNMDMSSWGISIDYSGWIDGGARSGFSSRALDELVKGCYVPTSSILVRKSIFDEVDGFDCTLKFYEDYDLTLRLANHSRIALTNNYVGKYIRCGDSFGQLAQEPTGLAAEIQVLSKVVDDQSYPDQIRKTADARIGKVLFDISYLYRKRGRPYLSAVTALKSIAHKNGPLWGSVKNLLFCLPDALAKRHDRRR
jgi:glycosyltransferase involved in cell wall biosynthesis